MTKFIATICSIGLMTSNNLTIQAQKSEQQTDLTMLVGTYTSGTSQGIYSFRLNQETGQTIVLSETVIENPSYLTPSTDGCYVYAVSEFGDNRASVTAFAFDKVKGTFQRINTQPTQGKDPCYIIANNHMVIAANYSGGSVSAFPIDKQGGLKPLSMLKQFSGKGTDSIRQEKPHLHCVQFTPDGKYLFANDLGTDRIYRFTLSKKQPATLAFNESAVQIVKAGSGPRHLTFSPNGKQAYLINELSGTVIAFDYANGQLTEIQTIAADTMNAKGSADIHISPDGKFLYASNRLKADGIAIFNINPKNGRLSKVGYQLTGIHPRNFIITPNGQFLLVACRDSNVIHDFKRDLKSGILIDIKQDIKVNKPV